MKPRYAAAISLILALAVGAGAYAAQRTTAAAADRSATTSAAKDVPAQIAKRSRALDRMEASLRKALRQRPPALPKMPHYKPVKVPAVASSAAGARADSGAQTAVSPPPAPVTPRIVTVRPPPHIVIVPRKGGEHEDGEHEDTEHEDGDHQSSGAAGQSEHEYSGAGADD